MSLPTANALLDRFADLLREIVREEIAAMRPVAPVARPDDELLKPGVAARMLGVTRQTLAKHSRAWGLDIDRKLGPRHPRYNRAQVEARRDDPRHKVLARRPPEPLRVVENRPAEIAA